MFQQLALQLSLNIQIKGRQVIQPFIQRLMEIVEQKENLVDRVTF